MAGTSVRSVASDILFWLAGTSVQSVTVIFILADQYIGTECDSHFLFWLPGTSVRRMIVIFYFG